MIKNKQEVKLSVVIVSFNTKEILVSCIKSLYEHTKSIAWELIIVDNASTDGSEAAIKQQGKVHKNIKTIFKSQNLGFSAGNNLGIREAQGEYILLLNSDTLILENTLHQMVEWMDKKGDVGAASCMLLNPDMTVQDNGGRFPGLFHLFLWSTFLDDLPYFSTFMGSYHPKPNLASHVKEQDWVKGAFMMIRSSVLRNTGGFDENIFMYGEDVELCYRIKKNGWKVFYVPTSKIIHLGGASGSTLKTITGEYKGLIYFYKKHKNMLSQFLMQILLKIGAILRVIILGIVLQRRDLVKIYIEAFKIS